MIDMESSDASERLALIDVGREDLADPDVRAVVIRAGQHPPSFADAPSARHQLVDDEPPEHWALMLTS